MIAWRFWSDRASRPWAAYSLLTGLLIIACFVASNVFSVLDAEGSLKNAPTGFMQRIAIVGGWTWITLVAWHLIRKDEAKNRLRG